MPQTQPVVNTRWRLASLMLLTLGLLKPATSANANSWSGEAELGLLHTRGNKESTHLNTKAKASTQQDAWKHSFSLEALNSSNDAGTSAERYLLAGKSDYTIGAQSYLFGLLKWEKDRFSGLDYQLDGVLGYGWRVLREAPFRLDLEIGGGTRRSALNDSDHKDELIGWSAANLHWQISPTSFLTEQLTIEQSDSTIARSVTALTSKINSTLAMKASFTAKHNSEAPTGKEKTDTETAVTLVLSY